MSLGDPSRLATLTNERARALARRIRATRYAERAPLPIEIPATTLMPEELRAPLVAWALSRDPAPAAALALLFQYLQPARRSAVRQALFDEGITWLVEAGIIETLGDTVRSRFRLAVFDDVYIWSDDTSAGTEAVMAPGPTTIDLLRVLPARVSGSLLDVGTGPGTIALVAARRGATPVVATDISERAAMLARFNAAFNGLDVDVRVGDMFAPVTSDRFDWIVSQPPYVTHPADEPGVTFLHGGEMGDELAMRVLEGVTPRLRADGVALLLFDSPVRRGSTLEERVRRALGESPDVVAMRQPGLNPDRQALGYAALADPTFGKRYAEAAIRYRAHLEARRVEQVEHALVVARARADRTIPPWTMSLTVARFPDDWSELDEFIRGIDIAVAGEDAIVKAHVRPRAGAMITIERAAGASRGDESRSIRFATPSLALDREVTAAAGVIFDLLTAESSVETTIARFAAAMERPVADVRPLVTSFVHDCLVHAVLVPSLP